MTTRQDQALALSDAIDGRHDEIMQLALEASQCGFAHATGLLLQALDDLVAAQDALAKSL